MKAHHVEAGGYREESRGRNFMEEPMEKRGTRPLENIRAAREKRGQGRDGQNMTWGEVPGSKQDKRKRCLHRQKRFSLIWRI